MAPHRLTEQLCELSLAGPASDLAQIFLQSETPQLHLVLCSFLARPAMVYAGEIRLPESNENRANNFHFLVC